MGAPASRYVAFFFFGRTFDLVSCPARARLPTRNGLVNKVEFLGLIPKTVEDQWDSLSSPGLKRLRHLIKYS